MATEHDTREDVRSEAFRREMRERVARLRTQFEQRSDPRMNFNLFLDDLIFIRERGSVDLPGTVMVLRQIGGDPIIRQRLLVKLEELDRGIARDNDEAVRILERLGGALGYREVGSTVNVEDLLVYHRRRAEEKRAEAERRRAQDEERARRRREAGEQERARAGRQQERQGDTRRQQRETGGAQADAGGREWRGQSTEGWSTWENPGADQKWKEARRYFLQKWEEMIRERHLVAGDLAEDVSARFRAAMDIIKQYISSKKEVRVDPVGVRAGLECLIPRVWRDGGRMRDFFSGDRGGGGVTRLTRIIYFPLDMEGREVNGVGDIDENQMKAIRAIHRQLMMAMHGDRVYPDSDSRFNETIRFLHGKFNAAYEPLQGKRQQARR